MAYYGTMGTAPGMGTMAPLMGQQPQGQAPGMAPSGGMQPNILQLLQSILKPAQMGGNQMIGNPGGYAPPNATKPMPIGGPSNPSPGGAPNLGGNPVPGNQMTSGGGFDINALLQALQGQRMGAGQGMQLGGQGGGQYGAPPPPMSIASPPGGSFAVPGQMASGGGYQMPAPPNPGMSMSQPGTSRLSALLQSR